ncbi:unnamed protein product [Microthlaspi erraticum]|uniref:Uncharacterized protein n=1 Tax=Microthlaspi erraticum TaxID=1685480 RepID=A0A6D2I0X0_9BRAS|nr:unnamed protein product [Microthlaspi erraticum]
MRTPDSSTIQRPTKTSLRLSGLPTTASSKRSSSKAKGATHTSMKKRKKRSSKLDRVSRTQSSGVLLTAVYHLQTTTLPPGSLGGTEVFSGDVEWSDRVEEIECNDGVAEVALESTAKVIELKEIALEPNLRDRVRVK